MLEFQTQGHDRLTLRPVLSWDRMWFEQLRVAIMTSSMTAFSRQQSEQEWGSLTWEIRSVNHRYLETSIRLPDIFRSLENQVLSAISQRHSLVVATGGGVVTQPENWGMLHSGIVIWLDVVPDQLLQRLNADSTVRPLLQTADPEVALSLLLSDRRSLYAEADLTVVINDETPEAVADGILQLVPSLLTDPTHRRTD